MVCCFWDGCARDLAASVTWLPHEWCKPRHMDTHAGGPGGRRWLHVYQLRFKRYCQIAFQEVYSN